MSPPVPAPKPVPGGAAGLVISKERAAELRAAYEQRRREHTDAWLEGDTISGRHADVYIHRPGAP